MKKLIRRIVIVMMKIWHEDRKERRRRADSEKTQSLHNQMRRSTSIVNAWEWEKLPDRLRDRIRKGLPAWLQESAESADTELPQCIANVRAVGVAVTPEDERNLYKVAMAYSRGHDKIPFAKMLHGNPLPLNAILELLRQSQEYSKWFRHSENMKVVAPLLQEIDTEDAEAVNAFLSTIASEGRYQQLKIAYACLRREVSTQLVRTCLHAHWNKDHIHFGDLKEMCILLQDWTLAEKLLNQMLKYHDPDTRALAGELAINLYLHAHEAQPA